jgi:hypothetical protein
MADNTNSNRRHRGGEETQVAQVARGMSDSAIILKAEDGNGKGYFTVHSIPEFDGSDKARATYAIGFWYDALRKAQSVAKSAKKDGKDVQSAIDSADLSMSEIDPTRLTTVGAKKIELAKPHVQKMLASNPKFASASSEVQEATVAKYAVVWLGTKPEIATAVDGELAAFLAAGYTPTKRGAGGKTESGEPTALDIEL